MNRKREKAWQAVAAMACFAALALSVWVYWCFEYEWCRRITLAVMAIAVVAAVW